MAPSTISTEMLAVKAKYSKQHKVAHAAKIAAFSFFSLEQFMLIYALLFPLLILSGAAVAICVAAIFYTPAAIRTIGAFLPKFLITSSSLVASMAQISAMEAVVWIPKVASYLSGYTWIADLLLVLIYLFRLQISRHLFQLQWTANSISFRIWFSQVMDNMHTIGIRYHGKSKGGKAHHNPLPPKQTGNTSLPSGKANTIVDWKATLTNLLAKLKNPRGADRPREIQANWTDCFLILSLNNSETTAGLVQGIQYVYRNDTEEPGMLFRVKGNAQWNLYIGIEHLDVVNASALDSIKFKYIDDTDALKLTDALTQLHVLDTTQDQVQTLEGFFKSKSIVAISYRTIKHPRCPLGVHCISEGSDVIMPEILGQIRECIDTAEGARLTVVAGSKRVDQDLKDPYWMQLVDMSCRLTTDGRPGSIHPSTRPFEAQVYKDEKGCDELLTNLEAMVSGKLAVTVYPHMAYPPSADDLRENIDAMDADEPKPPQKFTFFHSPHFFPTIDSWFVRYCLALAGERQYQQYILDTIFAADRQAKLVHVVRITKFKWRLFMQVNVPNDFKLPAIPEDTKFKLHVNSSGHIVKGSSWYECKSLELDNIDGKGNLALEYSEKESDPPVEWKHVSLVNLTATFNDEPFKRNYICSKIVHGWNYDILLASILGHRWHKFPSQPRMSNLVRRTDLNTLEMLREEWEGNESTNGVKLNYWQNRAFTLSWLNDGPLTMIVGPPGSGKSLVLSFLARVASFSGVTVTACSASGGATRALARKIVDGIQALEINFPSFEHVLKVTVWSSNSQSEHLALEHCFQTDEKLLKDSDHKFLLEYQWFHRAIEKCRTRGDVPFSSDESGAQEHKKWAQWMQLWKIMRVEHKHVAKKDWNFFYKYLKTNYLSIIDEDTNILISTVNNLARVHTDSHKGYLDKVRSNGLTLIDEAAFDQEYSTVIPLSLGAPQNLMVGDHFQLRPVVTSKDCNPHVHEYSKVSMFERLYNYNTAVPRTILRTTYRLVPELSELIGGLRYNGLASAPRSEPSFPTPWKAFVKWFTKSKYNANRRALPSNYTPNDNEPNREEFRRIFLNVQGRSSKSRSGSSTVNHANINALCDFVQDLQGPGEFDEYSRYITVLTMYKGQVDEVIEQFRFRGILNVTIRTVDSYQGEEDKIIILLLDPANSNNGGSIGFLSDWNRVNVAVSRSIDTLVVIGNLDLWRSGFAYLRAKSDDYAKMAIDIVRCREIYDLDEEDLNHRLPVNEAEYVADRTGRTWSNECGPSPPCQPSALSGGKLRFPKKRGQVASGDKLTKLEQNALNELDLKLVSAKMNILAVRKEEEDATTRGDESEVLALIKTAIYLLRGCGEKKFSLDRFSEAKLDAMFVQAQGAMSMAGNSTASDGTMVEAGQDVMME